MRIKGVFALFCLLLSVSVLAEDDYTTYGELTDQLREISTAEAELVTLHSIGKSRAGADLWVVRIASAGAVEPDKRPALFIGGNIEGVRLAGTEAALACITYLIENKDDEEIAALLSTNTFYIVPAMNPDVMNRLTGDVISGCLKSDAPINDDGDDEVDEDGPDDLNGDGYITKMRYLDPAGTMIVDTEDDRIMKKADPMKGEKGLYKVIVEGMDNDNDGLINEDGTGGVILNMNFPHDFQYFTDGPGPWAVYEPEAEALVEFFLTHTNIAMVYTFGSENNLLNLQKGKQAAKAGSDMVKVPRRFARFLGLDADTEYHIDDLVELIKDSPMGRQMNVTKQMVIQFLGAGPVMSIQNDDYTFYEEVSKRYKEMIKEAKVDDDSRKPKPVLGDGSFVSWAYYHFGVPSFSVDLWDVPKKKEEKKEGNELSVEKLKGMTSEEFLALGEEKIDAFLKAQGAEERITASRLMDMVKGGMVTPERMATMMEQMGGAGGGDKKAGNSEKSWQLNWAAENLPKGGFVPWTEFDHPTLGTVEIGGEIPLATVNPPLSLVQDAFEPNAEFAVKLAKCLPSIQIIDAQVKTPGSGVYEIVAYVENSGYFPTAMTQGTVNRKVPPILVKLEGDVTFLAGQPVHRFPAIAGNSKSSRMRWVVQCVSGTDIMIVATSGKSGNHTLNVTLQ